MATQSRNHEDYTVGWICALPKERTAARAMLDEKHPDLPKSPNDHNSYTLGSIGEHNVAIACLPIGRVGPSSAATVATRMIDTFPSIKFGLMVGIGGGMPPKVRLGDVVVGTPIHQYPGVVQWDFGKAKAGGKFERTGSLNNPPQPLLAALTNLQTDHEMVGSKVDVFLMELENKYPKLVPKYLKSESREDILFKAHCRHIDKIEPDDSVAPDNEDEDEDEDTDECSLCDKTQIVKRKRREMRVHYGLIASGSQVIKDAERRDALNKELNGDVLCIEMEAAGLVDSFPCLVIRGICDYADSHKYKKWQEYSAAVAAAFAKEILGYVQPSDVDRERPVKDIISQVHDTVTEVKSKLDRDEDRKVLDWVTPIDYGSQYSDFFVRRQKGTGKRLLNSDEYREWLRTKKKTLFCPGIPGAGKTILTSIVIDDIAKRYNDDTATGLAYIFCNFRQQDTQKIDDLLASLLKQLTQGQPSLPASVKQLYDLHQARRTRPRREEISKALQSIAAKYSRVFIIVDALDECQVSDGDREEFLSELFNVREQTGLNLFATSRFNPKIEEAFEGSMTVEIRAIDEDIQNYLGSQIQRLPSFVKRNVELQNTIMTEITKAVDGMFLLAQLYIGLLEDTTATGEVRKVLAKVRKQSQETSARLDHNHALEEAYQSTLQRIEKQNTSLQKLAKKVLSWIVFSKRPLLTSELQHALSIDLLDHVDRENLRDINNENIRDIGDMVSVCAGLVTVDQESNIIRLAHYTTQEYFERIRGDWDPHADLDIASTCLTYLCFDTFGGLSWNTSTDLKNVLEQYVFLEYAARYWPQHVVKVQKEIFMQALAFLQCNNRMTCALNIAPIRPFYYDSRRDQKKLTGLHLVVGYGLVDLVELLLQLDGVSADPKDGNRRTPLSWAAIMGHEAVVELLLRRNVDADHECCEGRTPLSFAAEYGHEGVVKIFLQRDDVDVNSKDNSGRTPLSWATVKGHEGVVKLFFQRDDVGIDSKDIFGKTPLSFAAQFGHEGVVKLFLQHNDVDVNSKDNSGRTPLSWATMDGREGVIRLLLQRADVQVDFKDDKGQTPLVCAAIKGDEKVVTLLLQRDVNTDSMDNNGWTALEWATKMGYERVVNLLKSRKHH